MAFETFRGNNKLKENLISLIYGNKLPHAMILDGEKGIGKKTLAYLIAAALICRQDNPPCGACADCRNVLAGKHPDVLFYESENHRPGSFKVDTVRNMRDEAFVIPNQSDFKVFIVHEADYMAAAAQNALLKVLEEPPKYVVFVLLCENKNQMLETILSRATVFSLSRVSRAEATEYISSLLPETDYAEIESAVSASDGNIGKALEIIRGDGISRVKEVCENIASAVLAPKEFDLLKAMAVFEKDKVLLSEILMYLQMIFRDALVQRSGGKDLFSGAARSVALLAQRLTKKQILNLINAAAEAEGALKRNANQQLLITRLCAKLYSAAQI